MKRLKTLRNTLLSLLFIILGYMFKSNIMFIISIVFGGFTETVEGVTDSIENKRLNTELLMIFSAIGAMIISYYSEAAMLLFIFSLSGALEQLTLDRSTKEINELISLQEQYAKVIQDDNSIKDVLVEDLKVKDKILVPKGSIIPIDGIIIKGSSSIEESIITGESNPVRKKVNDDVYGATMNLSSSITIEVTKELSNTMLYKIIKLVEEAQENESNTARLIKRMEDSYAKIVLISVFLVIVIPIIVLKEDFNSAFYRGMILLVVASPCALIASVTPASLSAISNSANKNILIKGSIHLENLMNIDAVLFDKTGTITEGLVKVNDIYIEKEEDEIKDALLSIERHSNHPLANAIVNYLENIKVKESTNILEKPGFGISGTYNRSNYKFGNIKFVKNNNKDILNKTKELQVLSNIIIYIEKDNKLIGYISLKDNIRDDAIDTIKFLKDKNIKTYMITGDNELVAKAIGKEINIENTLFEVLPDEKSDVVTKLKKEHRSVVMIGDGINDAPALANSTVGISMGNATDIAIESSDIVLVNNSLKNIEFLYKLSKKLKRVITENIIFSFSVIVLLITLNFFSVITLPQAVVFHEMSTILVILNGLRLLRLKR